ncbi:MAG TPA: hypothetical protein VFP84_21825 [Kofleriaceae bacterium]|nr:hypothetical protein [Kofleriaceae bacterium]
MKSAAPAAPAREPGAPPPFAAPHGGSITALAALEDGSAVVSVDNNGYLRLWPTLDGTREPVVIRGAAPHALAIARDGDGFAIATIDDAGGAHLIRTTAAGAVRAQRALADASAERAVEVDATPAGFLILRADQSLELIAASGERTQRLLPEPGTHIDSILSRGRHALALVLEDKKRLRGQWIETAPTLRWGKVTPVLEGKIAHAALSPDGDRLAVSRPRGLHPQLIDLETGKALPTALCVTKGWPREDGIELDASELAGQNMLPVPLGFVDGATVACEVMTSLAWWGTDGSAIANRSGGLSLTNDPAVVSDAGVVAAFGGNLALGRVRQENLYLGYQVHSLKQVFTGPGGALVTSGQEALELDGALAARARFDLSRRTEWERAVPLDAQFAIVMANNRYFKTGAELAVFDGLSGLTRQVLPYHAGDDDALSYEPTTRLLATRDGGRALLLRLDPVSHLFGPPIWLANGITSSKLRVVDPQLAGGVAALELDTGNGEILVGEITEADVAAGGPLTPRTTYRVPGELRAVDRAGRLYARATSDGKAIDPWRDAAGEPAPVGDIIVYTHGAPGAHLTGMAALEIRPNGDGSLIAAFASPRIALFGGDGKPRWDTAQWNAKAVDWMPDGHLAVMFETGMATIDAATGGLADRRCGWSFGLSPTPLDNSRPGPSICDAR